MVDKDLEDAMAGFNQRLLEMVQPINYNEIFRSAELSKVQSTAGILQRFSVSDSIAAIDREIKSLEAKYPDRYLVVTMRTIDGRIMDVQKIRPEGFSTYIAEGHIDGMPCMIAAHASTLNLFIAFEQKRDSKRAGFVIELPRALPTEPPQESELKEPDKIAKAK